ncbi:MAG: hypothetical protein ACE5JA_03070, partial [bacterium]
MQRYLRVPESHKLLPGSYVAGYAEYIGSLVRVLSCVEGFEAQNGENVATLHGIYQGQHSSVPTEE